MALPPLNALRAFEAVARLGSFKAAAEALFVTQSAVSHQIKNFEAWLGAPLFRREGNRATLLPFAEDLASSLSYSLAEIDAACHRAKTGSQDNELVVAAIPSVSMCWLIPKLADFKQKHPEIETRIVYALHGFDIDFSNVHVAFTLPEPPTSPDVEPAFFLSGDSVPVCSPALLDRHALTPDGAIDLHQLGLLHDGDTTGWQRWFETDAIGAAHTDPYRAPTFEDFNLLRAAALSAQGVALCPLAMVQPDLDVGALVQLSDRRMSYGSDYYLIRSRRVPLPIQKKVNVFCEWALAER